MGNTGYPILGLVKAQGESSSYRQRSLGLGPLEAVSVC